MLAAALIAAILSAQAPEAGPETLQALLDEARAEAGAPGMALAVWSDGAVAVEVVSGERAKGSGVMARPGDPWHLGSNTKAMTAALAAALADAGRLRLDLTVGEALDEAVPDMRAGYRDVDFAELFTHRSGLPANVGMRVFLSQKGTDEGRDARADRIDYARAVLGTEPEGSGGFRYSNAGYVVAGAMMEEALDASYESLMRDEIFGPLGLDSAGFGPPGSADAVDTPRGHARRFVFFGGPAPQPPGAGADNPPAMSPAGRAHMSLPDYLAFVGDQMACARDGKSALVSAAGCAWLHDREGDYRFGWGVREDGRWSHAGSNTMWFVRVFAWPDEDLAIVAAANAGHDAVSPALSGLLDEAAALYAPDADAP